MTAPIMLLNEIEFNKFPDDFQITLKVFHHYYNIAFADNNKDILNQAQLTLCLHFICDGLIDNSGFFSILLETNGKYNMDYSKSLERCGNITDKAIFDEIISIYDKYENWFSNQTNPPALEEGSDDYDYNLANRIERLEEEWFQNSTTRNNLFKEYFINHKLQLVTKE